MGQRHTVAGRPLRARLLLATFRDNAALLFGILALMWAVELLNQLPFLQLERFGIRPRSIDGLAGIFCAPLLHVGFRHLLANSVPFVVLGGLVLLGGRRLFWSVTLFVTIAGGFAVWLVAGRFTNHIGASGLIFGYLGFLLARGYFERSPAWMLTALAIMTLYGSLLFGVLPIQAGVSWQSHLFGFAAGVAAAGLFLRGPRAA